MGWAMPGVSTVIAAWRPVKYVTVAAAAPAGYSVDAVVVAHAALGSITPIRSTSTAAIHHAIGKCTIIGWTLGAHSGSRFTTSGRQRCERYHEDER